MFYTSNVSEKEYFITEKGLPYKVEPRAFQKIGPTHEFYRFIEYTPANKTRLRVTFYAMQ